MRSACLAVFLAAAAVAALSCGGDGPERGPFGSPRGLSLSPSGAQLLVADAGSGRNDGRVLRLTLPSVLGEGSLAADSVETIMDGLPSRRVSGRGYTSVAGPAAAAMAEDGVVCVAIGAHGPDQAGELRCSDGLRVDLTAFESERNPDGGSRASDPAGLAADGLRGWFVADAAANTVLFVDRWGAITVVAVFADVDRLGAAGIPTGLHAIEGRSGPLVAVALYAGALAGFAPAQGRPPLVELVDGRPIAIVDDATETIALLRSDARGREGSGAVFNLTTGETLVSGLDRPSGMVALPGGRFIVSFESSGAVEIFASR